MKITDIKVRRKYNEGTMRAVVSIVIDDCFAVHELKVVEGKEREFVAMPSRRDYNGVFRDIVHPLNPEVRKMIEDMVLAEYYKTLQSEGEQEA